LSKRTSSSLSAAVDSLTKIIPCLKKATIEIECDTWPTFDQVLQQLQDQQALKFELSNDSELPLTSSIAFGLTQLNLQYDATAENILGVNILLRNLPSSLPHLNRLELRPNDEIFELPMAQQQCPEVKTQVSDVAHDSLEVLRLRLGHESMLEVDWDFLKSLKKLKVKTKISKAP